MLLVAAAPNVVRAALGASADSVVADGAAFNAAGVSSVAHPAANAPGVDGYTVARMTTAAGIAVSEFVGPDGKVFAVTWRGRRPPIFPSCSDRISRSTGTRPTPACLRRTDSIMRSCAAQT